MSTIKSSHTDPQKRVLFFLFFVLFLATALPVHAREENYPSPGSQALPADGANAFRKADAAELFGHRRGIFHPFFTVREEWTDNLYNVHFDEQSNFLSIISPGLWLSFPRLDETPLKLTTSNSAVAGRRFFFTERNTFERFQAYLLGGLDYNSYSADSDLNHTNWQVEGLFQYSMPFGLSWRFIDRLVRNRDKYDIGSFLPSDLAVENGALSLSSTPSLIRKYKSNLAAVDLQYALHDRISALFNYSNFHLSYEDEINEWLNRTDDSLTFSLSYAYSPKTSLFVEYTHAFLSYEQDIANDSENMYYYGGLDWKGSARTSLIAKGGYQRKKFDQPDQEDLDTFLLEARLHYAVTEKTKLSLNLYKALEESDFAGSWGMDTVLVRMRYDQLFSYRFAGYCEFDYERNDYEGLAPLASGPERRDIRFMIKPAILYTLRDRLTGELAFSFEDRDSDDNLYDFTSRTVFLSLHFAL